MGVNDAQEMLEAAQAECIRLEHELAEVRAIAEVNAMNMTDFMEMQADRDDALAVIEQIDDWFNGLGDRPVSDGATLARLLEQSPASALAKVKADTLRAFAAYGDENFDHHYWGYDDMSAKVRAYADRIEKEVG